MPGLTLRKLADYSDGSARVSGFHPLTGQKTLIDPATNEVKPWPLLGVTSIGPMPEKFALSQSYAAQAVSEGWMTREGERIAHAAGGPPDDQWRVTHTFIEADALVFRLVEGEFRYRVVRQPGKDETTGEVDWSYELELEA